jgi:hypothetical protein
MSEDGIYKRLESLLSGSEPVAPDPAEAKPPAPGKLPRPEAPPPAEGLGVNPALSEVEGSVEGETAISAAPAAEPVPFSDGGSRADPIPHAPAATHPDADAAPPEITTIVRVRPDRRSRRVVPPIVQRPPHTRPDSAGLRFNPREWPLATQLALIIALLVTAAIAAATAITTRTVRLSLTEQIGNDFVVEAQGHVDQIKRYFLEKGGQLQTLSFSDRLRSAVIASNAAYTGSDAEIQAEMTRRDEAWRFGGRADPFILGVISQIQ